MNRKILFTDLDGTLLNDEKQITPGNQAAIDEALAQGHVVVISTGRPLSSAKIQAQRLGLNKKGCYAITFNGGQIYDLYHETTIYGKGLPLEVVPPIFHAAHQMGVHIQTYDDRDILSEYETPELIKYAQINGIPYRIVPQIEEALTVSPYKLIAIDFQNQDKLARFQQEVLTQYSDQLHSFLSSDALLEIVPVGISKGFAVRWMCDYLELPLEASVAAGDAQNDIAMLEAAHVGAVMCNAYPGIAEHGNYITKADNNHDGVAEIIHRFILAD
jgi:Cof subfamily protein (haloacid dehalogenase superfamily)